MCNASTTIGDVDGDGASDIITIGSVIRADGDCPTEGQRDRLLTIDLGGGGSPEVESTAIDCSTWCFPFAAVDLSSDGTAEILVNEGHTAPPASAVIGVYELVRGVASGPNLEPVLFPNRTNRFVLVNPWQGYHGAYCPAEGDLFTTWHGETDGDGGLVSLTYREYRMNDRTLRFEQRAESTIDAAELPPRGSRGYDEVFCGVKVEGLG